MNTLKILHLSDTHLNGGGTLHSGVVDTVANLRGVLAKLAHLDQLDLLVVSGDVSDDGSAESYELTRTLLLDFARVRGAAVVLAMGNHDQRETFRQVLGSGHLKSDDTAQVNTAQVNTAQVNTAQVNTAQVNTAQVNTAQVNTAQVNTAQ
ncbi:metallophosphoesterase, partial [Paeniglutamicibacter antarcticus]